MNSLANALTYENFIRGAFNVERSGDPAELAEAGLFRSSDPNDFVKIKVATAYAMVVYSRNLTGNDFDYDRLDQIPVDATSASNHETLIELIKEFKDSFI